MTDYEKMKALFDSLGIGYMEHVGKDELSISCTAGEDKKVGGDYLFFASFCFKMNGDFVTLIIGE